jgi:hypothetical protein
VSDYLIISSNTPGGAFGTNITLVSDGFSRSLLVSLLSGLTLRQPQAADGTPITVSEPAEGIFNQSVEFFSRRPAALRIISSYSATPPQCLSQDRCCCSALVFLAS